MAYIIFIFIETVILHVLPTTYFFIFLLQSLWEKLLPYTEDYQFSLQSAAILEPSSVTPVFRLIRHSDEFSVVILDARENMKVGKAFLLTLFFF